MRAAHAKSYGAGTVRERGPLAYAEHSAEIVDTRQKLL